MTEAERERAEFEAAMTKLGHFPENFSRRNDKYVVASMQQAFDNFDRGWEAARREERRRIDDLRNALELMLKAAGPQSLTFGELHAAITAAKAALSVLDEEERTRT